MDEQLKKQEMAGLARNRGILSLHKLEKTKETKWIKKLRNTFPCGLDDKIEGKPNFRNN